MQAHAEGVAARCEVTSKYPALLPCPFCGRQPEQQFTAGGSEMFLRCACGVRMFASSDLEVIERWNRRTPQLTACPHGNVEAECAGCSGFTP